MNALRLAVRIAALVGILAVPRVALAQEAPPTPMTPSGPHEHLVMFVGTWTIAEFPAEASFRETCDWLGAGRRHMVCHSRWQAASGPREGLSIFSYREADSTYVYQGFRPSGAVQTLQGRVSEDGQTWEFWGEEGTGADRKRTRVQITPLGDGTFRFVEQTASGDAEWSAEETVTYRPASPAVP